MVYILTAKKGNSTEKEYYKKKPMAENRKKIFKDAGYKVNIRMGVLPKVFRK